MILSSYAVDLCFPTTRGHMLGSCNKLTLALIVPRVYKQGELGPKHLINECVQPSCKSQFWFLE